MNFAYPEWLWVAVVVGVLLTAATFWFPLARRRRALRFAGDHFADRLLVGPDRLREQWKWWLCISGTILLCVALARPLGELLEGGQALPPGVDMVVAVDISRSMLARDAGERTRLEMAGEAVRRLLENSRGGRTGLVVFRGAAQALSPMTSDTAGLSRITGLLDPGMVGLGGTSIPRAIDAALKLFGEEQKYPRVIWLISNGENLEGDLNLAARNLAGSGVRLVVAGVGTSGGERILLPGRDGTEAPLRHMGREVVTRKDAAVLARLAAGARGTYLDLESPDDLANHYREAIEPMRKPRDLDDADSRRQWYPLPLAIALLALILDWLVRHRPAVARQAALLAMGAAMWVPAAALAAPEGISGDGSREIVAAWEAGEFDRAFEIAGDVLLKKPGEPDALYNYALSAYRAGDWKTALGAWESLANEFPEYKKARVAFQLGNTRYRMAGEGEGADRLNGELHIRTALGNYQDAEQQGLEAAAHNASLAQRDLVRLLSDKAAQAASDAEAHLARDGNLEKALEVYRAALADADEAVQLSPAKPPLQELHDQLRARFVELSDQAAAANLADGRALLEAAERRWEKAGGLDGAGKRDALRKMKPSWQKGIEALQTARQQTGEAAELSGNPSRNEEAARLDSEIAGELAAQAEREFQAAETLHDKAPSQSRDALERGLEQLAAAREALPRGADGEPAPSEQKDRIEETLRQKYAELAAKLEAAADARIAAAAEARSAEQKVQQLADAAGHLQEAVAAAEAGKPDDRSRLETKSEQTADALAAARLEAGKALRQQAREAEDRENWAEAVTGLEKAAAHLAAAAGRKEEAIHALSELQQQMARLRKSLPAEDRPGSDPGEGSGSGRQGKPGTDPVMLVIPDTSGRQSEWRTRRDLGGRDW